MKLLDRLIRGRLKPCRYTNQACLSRLKSANVSQNAQIDRLRRFLSTL